MNDARILVLGDVMLDRNIIGGVYRISAEAPVPVVLIQQETDTLGGAGNVACNIRTLGHPVTLLSVCGSDAAGLRIGQLAKQHEIEAHLIIDDDRPTTTKTRVLAGNMQQILRLDHESTTPISEELTARFATILCSQIHMAQCLVISDYAKGCITDRLARIAVNMANKLDIPVIVDSKRADLYVYRGSYLATPNLQETAILMGKVTIGTSDQEVKTAAEHIRQKSGIANILITRGADGMTLCTVNTTRHIKATAQDVYDVTGAGDTVVATLAVMLTEDWPLVNAAVQANCAGGIAVSKHGTQPVRRDELQQVYNNQCLLPIVEG